ncbi:MAG TPA: TIR domain-containing protein [Fibrobacteria bacterium]|nr:TIR domain-containing protein [Fibrobacteria bacterium]
MDSGALFQRKKRKVYVSYDHHADAAYYERFAKVFGSRYTLARDNSIEREIGTDDRDAFIDHLASGAMKESACTVVLCGPGTPADRFVDWEIKVALDQGDGLVGILLPGNREDVEGGAALPERFRRNFDSGFAVLCRWDEVIEERIDLTQRLVFSLDRAADLIDNSLPLKPAQG